MLPPIIRYITLNDLYSKYPENLMIIDKLSLVMLKALNRKTAINWIEERKDVLQKKHSVTEEAHSATIAQYGEMIAEFLYNSAPNMYDLCTERVNLVGNSIDKQGLLYNDFESAIEHYKKKSILSGTSPDTIDFNSVMEFLYLGRKSCAELN